MYTCNTGNPSSDGESIAQKLANMLDRNVEGPNGYVNANTVENGNPWLKSDPYVSSRPDTQTPGDHPPNDRAFVDHPPKK